MEWYYVRNGEAQGPVTRADLVRMAEQGELKPADLVWNSGMGDEWARADSVEGLIQAGTSPGRTPRPFDTAPVDVREPGTIKLIDPARYAWQGMVSILFRPFDLGKWFALGFSAWLATLGEGGGSFNTGSGGGNWSGDDGDVSMEGMISGVEDAWAPVRDFLHQYDGIVIAVVTLVVLLGVALGIVLLWLRSRGRFMLLDNVLKNRAEVTEPWHEWKQHANSLFRWSLVYGIICLLIVLGLLAMSWPLVIKPCVDARAFVPSVWGGIVTLIVSFSVFGLVGFYITRFLNDFIIPIMYRHNLTATEAWRKFLGLYHAHIGRFLTYGLFVIVLQFCAGAAILTAIVLTCFIAGCLMCIPYIGAVVLLPVTVFFRLYGVEYLAQYGGEFVVTGEEDVDEPVA